MLILDSVLRVPKAAIDTSTLETFTVQRRGKESFQLWDEDEEHYLFPVTAYKYFESLGLAPLKDLRTLGRRLQKTESLLIPREGQLTAVETVVGCLNSSLHLDQGIFVAGCGKGKTVMGTEIARRMQTSTCILVHKEYLGDQWVRAINMLVPGATIGFVRQERCDSGKDFDFVIASTQSLTSPKRIYPEEFYSSFGFLLLDEVHRYGAEIWHKVLQKFPAKYRLGLTATPRRFDGLWSVITSHLGEIFHELDSDSMTFKVYTVGVNSDIPRDAFEFSWLNDVQMRAKIISLISENTKRNHILARNLVKAYKANRFVMVISDRKEQLRALMNFCADLGVSPGDMGLFVGGLTKKDQQESINKSFIFTTYQMSQEGLDIERLDTLFLASPRSHIEQTVGRILRQFEGKNIPVVVDPIDIDIEEAVRWSLSRVKEYRFLGATVEGYAVDKTVKKFRKETQCQTPKTC